MPDTTFSAGTVITSDWLNEVNVAKEAVVNVKDPRYGATGDGVTDDTVAIQAAITAAYGSKLTIPEGTYTLSSELLITDSIEIEMAPGAVLDFSSMPAGVALGGRVAISASGSRGSNVAVTTNIARGDTAIVVASTTGLTAGDWVVVASDEIYSAGGAAGLQTRGHMAQIKSVDSGVQVTLYERSPFSYATASNAVIAKLSLIEGVRITGGQIVLGGVGSVHSGIRVNYGHTPAVVGVKITGAEDTGVSFANCVAPTVSKSAISDSTSPGGAIGNTGYGVAVYGGIGGRAESCVVTNCRHGIAGGGYEGVLSIGFKVTDCDVLWCGIGTWALDVHEPCFEWSFTCNTVHGGNGGAILRAPGTVFDGNHVLNVVTTGVMVQQFNDDTGGLPDVIVSNNRVSYAGGGGIWATGHTVTTDKITALIIADNNIVGAGGHSIYATYCVGLQVRGGSVRDQLGSARSGVYLNNCTGASVTGGRYDLSAAANAAPVYVESCTGVRVTDATLLGTAAATNQDGVRATGTTGLSVRGVIASGVSRYGVYTTTTDRVIVAHCDMKDATSATKILVSGATTFIVQDNIEAVTSIPSTSYGSGSPEGAVTAPIGSTFQRLDGGAGTTLYVKESGTGNTGWVAK